MNGRWTNRIRTSRAAPVRDGRVHLMVTLVAFACVCRTAAADDSKQADPGTDAELLEFLGSVDSVGDSQVAADDESWIDYLVRTDIGKGAKRGDPNGASQKPVETGAQPPASGDKKDD